MNKGFIMSGLGVTLVIIVGLAYSWHPYGIPVNIIWIPLGILGLMMFLWGLFAETKK